MIQLSGRFSKLLVLTGICLVLGAIFGLGSLALVKPLFGISINTVQDLLINPDGSHVHALKFLQLLNSLGLFVLPALLFAYLFMGQPLKDLRIKKGLSVENIFGIVLLYFSLMPFINLLVELNSQMHLPDAFSGIESWMKAKESKAADLTRLFLKMDTGGELIYNLILIAIIPAIGEELIFRGIVQRIFNKGRKNKHIGIWIAAILFSALHLQFYGFFPRMLLGAFFGYLFLWTGSLWAPILAHFINNGTAVLLSYYLGTEAMENSFDQLGASEGTYVYSIASAIFFSLLCYLFYQHNKPMSE